VVSTKALKCANVLRGREYRQSAQELRSTGLDEVLLADFRRGLERVAEHEERGDRNQRSILISQRGKDCGRHSANLAANDLIPGATYLGAKPEKATTAISARLTYVQPWKGEEKKL